MSKKGIVGIALALVLSIAAAGTGGFFIGKSGAESNYQQERELNIQLNRSDNEGLGEISETIYVTGHKNPDSDSVGSAIAYANLLQKLGYDARAVVLGDINKESQYILNEAHVEVPELFSDASGCTVVLVDHDDYALSANGLHNAKVIGTIDHHGDGDITTANQLVYDARPLGATATIVWIRYRNYGVDIDKSIATVLLGSILSDTSNLKYDSTTEADRKAVEILSKIAEISDTDAFYQDMHKAALSYDDMTDEEIFFHDYKEYDVGDSKYSIGCIDVYDEAQAKEMANRMKEIVPTTLTSTGMNMAFAQIGFFDDDTSVTYIVPSDNTAAQVIEKAFGDKAKFDGVAYVFTPGISRKAVLVPGINGVLESQPK